MPANRIAQILAEKRSITADTALRLARFLGADDVSGNAAFWLRLQATYELRLAETAPGHAAAMRKIKPIKRAS